MILHWFSLCSFLIKPCGCGPLSCFIRYFIYNRKRFPLFLLDEFVFPAGCSVLSVPCSTPDGSCLRTLWVPLSGSLCGDSVQQHALHPLLQSHVWSLQFHRGNLFGPFVFNQMKTVMYSSFYKYLPVLSQFACVNHLFN